MPFLAIDFPNFNPVAVAIGPIVIRWYALAYIVGIVLGWIYARALIKRERLWGGPPPIMMPSVTHRMKFCSGIFHIITRIRSKSSSSGTAACRSMAAISAVRSQ